MIQRPARLALGIAAALFLLLVGSGALVEVYTDALWFDGLGYGSVFWRRLGIGAGVGVVAGAVGAALVLVNLAVVLRHVGPVRLRRRYGNIEIAEEVPRRHLVLGIIAVAILAGWWLSALQFGGGGALAVAAWLKRGAWGVADPLFGHDLSYYVFSLPVYFQFIDFILVVLVWSAALVLLGYVLAGAVRWADRRVLVDDYARFHLVGLATVVVLLLGARYWLGRYGLLLDGSGIGGGLGYTDVHARLPAHRALAVLSVVTAGALLYGAWRRSWIPPVVAGGALAVAAVGVGHLYPSFVQKFQVEPNELAREAPYIDWNMEYTRRGFGLHDLDRRLLPYRRTPVPSWDALEARLTRLPLWDAEPLQTAYNQVQSIFGYYHFPHVDFDRYPTRGGVQQLAVAVREFNLFGLPESAQTWQTLRLNPKYVRGMGAVATPAAGSTGRGEPLLWLSNLNPVVRAPDAPPALELSNPGVYVGESLAGYVVLVPGRDSAFLGTPGEEFPAGIRLGAFPRLLAFAWRFRDKNLLFSGEITDDSRLVFRRSLKERLRTLAPFLFWDPDPYPVVSGGRIHWIVDGYSVASTFPLARPVQVEGAGRIRYMRNSVKAVVDAVTGDVRLYVVDENDPLVETYGRVFPELFHPLSGMPAELQHHLRYPRLYFRAQADILEEYHLERADAFYSGQDVWQLPQEVAGRGVPRTFRPTYTLVALPGETEPEFLLTLPFIARERQNMTALLVARNDPPNYGRLLLLELPRDQQIPGPSQVESVMEQDPLISSQLSLWRQAGSDVDLGQLRVVPLDSTFLYVEPLFLSAQESASPELQRVVVSDGQTAAMAPTLAEAVTALNSRAESPPAPGEDVPQPSLPAVAEWPRRALDLLRDAEQRLRNGDWSGFGAKWTELRELLQELSATS